MVGESEYDQILEFFEPLNAFYAEENGSSNAGLDENMQRKLFESVILSDDMQYFDTPQLFEDVDMENHLKNNSGNIVSDMSSLASYQNQNHSISNDGKISEESIVTIVFP